MIAGLLLAAGRSTRFGGDKLLALLRGQPVIFWSAAALASSVDALYVVLPAGDVARKAALTSLSATIVEHARHDEGMGSSIGAGVAALPEAVDAVVIVLADQPLVSRKVIRAVCERWREGGAAAVVPRYRDGRGHPVLFGRPTFEALSTLRGNRGARAVLTGLTGRGDGLAVIEVDDAMPIDVDTPHALRALVAVWRDEG